MLSVGLEVGLEAQKMTLDTEKLADLLSHELAMLIDLAERAMSLSAHPLP